MAGRIVNVLRSAPALLLAPESWLRTVFVLTGAALALALGIADFTILSLVATADTPAWATALAGVVLVGGPLLAGLVPAARQIEGVAAQSLLGVEFPDGPPDVATGWPQRRRTLGWFLLHVFTGALVVAAVLGLIALAGSWWTAPAAVATVLGTLLAGRFLAWLGRRCSGRPTPSDCSAWRPTPPAPPNASRLPSLVSEEAYRIVQEGLTNALKYSADHTATFGLSLDRETFGIRLSNPAGVRRAARAGRGLRGIEERAAVLGGTATAGPHDGRWVLSVTLPVRDDRP